MNEKKNGNQHKQSPCAWVIETVTATSYNSLEEELQRVREENAALQKRVSWLETQMQAMKDYLHDRTTGLGSPTQGNSPTSPTANPARGEPGGQAAMPTQPNGGQSEPSGQAAEQTQPSATQSNPANQSPQSRPGGQAAEQAQQSQVPSKAEQSEAVSQSEAAVTAKPVDEEKAEKWIRENLEQWLDKPCPFKKAQGRTWRQMAQNAGEKILIKGKPLPPRAYLHSIEGWAACNVWARLKAKVALEIGKLAACA